MRTYYHVDRGRSLRAGLALPLKDGLSVFGQAYWFKITANPPRLDDDATRREHSLETLRRERFGNLPGSRMTALFAAATLEEALLFAERIEPRPMVPVPIFEVTSSRAESRDSLWLDFVAPPDRTEAYHEAYWRGETTNHRPAVGPRRDPHFEVVLQHPVQVGAQVASWLP